MQQVLFWIPIKTSLSPDGIPIYGFGTMLVLAFLVSGWYLGRRAAAIGVKKETVQDLALWLLISGIIGARIVYMIQYRRPLSEFFQIWQGGIVFYGSAIGGWIGYWIFYYIALKKQQISTWKLADIIAPALCLGLALGRVGCLLNGCCYGQAACPDCPQIEFPLLTSLARDRLIQEQGYQTSLGFASLEHPPRIGLGFDDDPRTVVRAVERHSPAEKAGIRPGDKIVGVNGAANTIIVELSHRPDKFRAIRDYLQKHQRVFTDIPPVVAGEESVKVVYDNPEDYRHDLMELDDDLQGNHLSRSGLRTVLAYDGLSDLVVNWPRGKHAIQLSVERMVDGQTVTLPLPAFVPRTIGLYPTQLYETISMILLFFVLVSFYPYRRHEGQVFVLLMLGYAVHRFLNEILRNDTPIYSQTGGMTLSQTISALILLCGIALELWLRYLSRQPQPNSPSAPGAEGGHGELTPVAQ